MQPLGLWRYVTVTLVLIISSVFFFQVHYCEIIFNRCCVCAEHYNISSYSDRKVVESFFSFGINKFNLKGVAIS